MTEISKMHTIPYEFRGSQRHIHYTTHRDLDGETRANYWFNCGYGECVAGEKNDFTCPGDCQPACTPVEDTAIMLAIFDDLNRFASPAAET